MSYCEEKGKDKIIFLTKEDADPSTSTIKLQDDPSDAPVGLITPEGDINWSCPCLGGMAVGPCGPDFREAFECFHYRYGTFRDPIHICLKCKLSSCAPSYRSK